MEPITAAIAELRDERAELDALLTGLDLQDWSQPTPAAGWDVRDQVSHLADTNEVAVDTMRAGPRSLNTDVARFESAEAFTLSGCQRGRALTPAQVLSWFRRSGDAQDRCFACMDPSERVPWGLGMTARTLVTARLMEHWAHGLDIRDALGIRVEATDRLQSVAWLITRALPYAFLTSQTPLPHDRSLRVELVTTISGQTRAWSFGPEDATDLIAGDALEFCRLGVQRCSRKDTSLRFEGTFADTALDRLRAFL